MVPQPTPIRVGSWPGMEVRGNDFVAIFLNALRNGGCEISSIEQVEDIGRTDLDVLVLHWAEKVFWRQPDARHGLAAMRLLIDRLDHLPLHTRVVWIVHNLEPHDMSPEQARVWPAYMAALSARVDAALTLSPRTVGAVRRAFPGLEGKPVSYVWHPAYPGAGASPEVSSAAREIRGIAADARVLGYCGLIRNYKGVGQLVEAFSRTERADLRLLVAGRASSVDLSSWTPLWTSDARMMFDLRSLEPQEFNLALACCDVVVAPFRSYLHSGSLIHALSAGRAVLTPRTPFAESLQTEAGKDWVRLYDGDLTPGMLEDDDLTRPASGRPNLTELQPSRIGPRAVEFLRGLLAESAV